MLNAFGGDDRASNLTLRSADMPISHRRITFTIHAIPISSGYRQTHGYCLSDGLTHCEHRV